MLHHVEFIEQIQQNINNIQYKDALLNLRSTFHIHFPYLPHFEIAVAYSDVDIYFRFTFSSWQTHTASYLCAAVPQMNFP